ncbi:hypothetical protein [Agromyces salentinus]|nr:hypothetical protein [Agromyces salentinus]
MPSTSPTRSRARARAVALGASALLALTLAGCAPGSEPAPTPSPAPGTTDAAEPIFASDEEALAAAEKAYEAYEYLSLEIGQDGSFDVERILPLVTEKYAAEVIEGFEAFREAGLRTTGRNVIDSVSLVETNNQSGDVSIYLCRDVSGTAVINSANEDVTPADRDLRMPMVAKLTFDPESEALLVDGSELWPGDDFC